MRTNLRLRETVLLAAGVLLAAAGSGDAVTVFRYLRTLEGDPPLERSGSVAIARDTGEICVTDEAAPAIDVFDARGFHRFRTDAMADVRDPRDACLDAEGGFVFAGFDASGERTIQRLNFLGEPVEYSPERPYPGWSPRHLRITRDGDYLTVDQEGILCRHDPGTGALRWTLRIAAEDYERADAVGRPTETPDGMIWVPDAGLGQIHVVSPDGTRLEMFGDRGTKRGQIIFPVGLEFTADGDFLVLDRLRHKVLLFDAERRFLTEFGRIGGRPGDFYHPLSLAVDPEGLVYVGQGFEGRVQVFRMFDTADAPERVGPGF